MWKHLLFATSACATPRMSSFFYRARAESSVILTKDIDFILLLERLGPPPQIIWLTCGNTSNRNLRALLLKHFPSAKALLQGGEPLIEIS